MSMKTASDEAPDWAEEEAQKINGQKWSSIYSAGNKIPQTNAQIHPWTNTFTLAVKINTLC